MTVVLKNAGTVQIAITKKAKVVISVIAQVTRNFLNAIIVVQGSLGMTPPRWNALNVVKVAAQIVLKLNARGAQLQSIMTVRAVNLAQRL